MEWKEKQVKCVIGGNLPEDAGKYLYIGPSSLMGMEVYAWDDPVELHAAVCKILFLVLGIVPRRVDSIVSVIEQECIRNKVYSRVSRLLRSLAIQITSVSPEAPVPRMNIEDRSNNPISLVWEIHGVECMVGGGSDLLSVQVVGLPSSVYIWEDEAAMNRAACEIVAQLTRTSIAQKTLGESFE